MQPNAPEVVTDKLAGKTTTKAARAVLEELGPLSEIEIVIEIQRRGCRSEDDPRAVLHALRSGLRRNQRVGVKWGVTTKAAVR